MSRFLSSFYIRHKDSLLIAGSVLLWRFLIHMIAFTGSRLFPLASSANSWPVEIARMAGLLARWDSGWYISIAQNGYFFNEHANSSVVFFPLYPLLIRSLCALTRLNPVISGETISLFALIGALIVLHKLVRIDFNRAVANRTLLFLLIFPTSFFFASVYTESLFLLLAVCGFYAARKQQWVLAGVCGFAASLTRFAGVLVVVGIAVEYLQQHEFSLKKIRAQAQGSIKQLLFILGGFLGIGACMAYLHFKFGNALLFFTAQRTFDRWFEWPWVTLKSYLGLLLHPALQSSELYFSRALELASVIGFGALVYVVFKKLRISYAVFALGAYLLPLFSNSFQSMQRYVIVLFPCFIMLALLAKQPWLDRAILVFSTFLLVCSLVLFTQWHWAG